MDTSNFSFRYWEDRTWDIYEVPELNRLQLPRPVDRYVRGHLSWGKDVDRGLAIQRARGRKRLEANRAQFLADVLPLIADKLNSAAWRDLAAEFQRRDFYERGGFVRYVLGEKSAWVHSSETDKLAQCAAMGAQPEVIAV